MIESERTALGWMARQSEWDSAAANRIEALIAALGEENERQNLVAAASLEHVWQRHIVDSAQLLQYVPRETPAPWLDLGTGAGFPGLVIACLRPDFEVWMVESRGRRIEWLERMIAALDLPSARVLGQNLAMIETVKVGIISARAFAPLDRLLDLSVRFSTASTIWALPKGRSAAQELSALRGWQHSFHVEQSLTDPEAGIIVGSLAGRTGKRQ